MNYPFNFIILLPTCPTNMKTFVKFLNGDIISVYLSEKSDVLEKKDIRKAVFDHIKEYKKDEYSDLIFYQQIELEDIKDECSYMYAFIRTLDTFRFKEVTPWIKNHQEELEKYIQYLAEKRMIMALSGGNGFELHFIDRYKIDKSTYCCMTPNFKSIWWSTVWESDIKERKSKNYPFSRVVLEDNDNLREYGYGFQLLDEFPVRIGTEIFYVSTHLP